NRKVSRSAAAIPHPVEAARKCLPRSAQAPSRVETWRNCSSSKKRLVCSRQTRLHRPIRRIAPSLSIPDVLLARLEANGRTHSSLGPCLRDRRNLASTSQSHYH